MSLEHDILQQVASASDEAALEAVRVASLGKKGSISEQMKSFLPSVATRSASSAASSEAPATCCRISCSRLMGILVLETNWPDPDCLTQPTGPAKEF